MSDGSPIQTKRADYIYIDLYLSELEYTDYLCLWPTQQ